MCICEDFRIFCAFVKSADLFLSFKNATDGSKGEISYTSESDESPNPYPNPDPDPNPNPNPNPT